MDRVAFIDEQLATFKDSLKLYRELTESNFAQWVDKGPQFFDRPAIFGMNRTVKLGTENATVSINDNDFSTVAICPKDGRLLIESKFVSVNYIPVGNITVDVTPTAGGASKPVTLDEQGKGVYKGIAGEKYYVRVQSQVTKEQVNDLFGSYDNLTQQLQTWLDGEWKNYRPLWPTETLSTAYLAQLNGAAAGTWDAIKGAFDGIKRIFEILKDPQAFAHELGQSATDLIKLAKETPAAMERLMLLASDQAALFLLLKTTALWLIQLPPSVAVGKFSEQAASVLVTILIDIVLALVLTYAAAGSGIAYLGVRLANYGAKILEAVVGFVKAVFRILKAFIESIDKYKKVAARAAVGAFEKGKVKIGWGRQDHAKIREHEHADDHSKQSTNPDEKSATCAKKTCTNNCPVSMVTGEELLTLTDGQLHGLLPFEWTRLYRTSAAEIDCGLGYGWSHALAQRVDIKDDEVVWTDHENRITTFPLPSVQRPAITNSLSEAAIFLGDDPSELILTQAGERAQFYHFRYNSKVATLIAISDNYGNRLHITRDIHGRIKRVDNGAGRALLIRYDRKHIVAIDYQQFVPADNLENAWSTIQNLITYSYDVQYRLIEAKNAAGEAERYTYNDQNVILERRLAGGASFYWEWEKEGKSARCIHHWASFSQMDAHYVWDDKGTVTVTNADGSEEIYTHDDQARLVAKVDPDGAEHLKVYDEKGRLIAEKNPLGAVSEYQYDAAGRLAAVIPPEDAPTEYEYSNGFVSEVRRDESIWKYQRNNQGDITLQIDPHGNETHYSYDRQGRLLEIRYPDGSRHQLGWNNLGQLLEERLPDGGQRKYRYDALGRQITRQEEAGAITHYQWDAVDRLTQVNLPGGATRAFTYNPYGRVTAERDELGRVTRYEYADGLHLVSRRINPDGSQLRYRYDNSRLLLTEIENERGEHYHLDYYANGLIQQETGFDGRRTSYEYDLNGQLLKKTEFGDDGSELATEYQRDAAGRLLVKILADGEEIHYSYDALGRLVNVDDGNWPLAYEYDLQDRLITEHQGWGTTRYEYDQLGQLSHCRLPDGSKLDYRHQSGGRLSSIDLNGSRLTSHQFNAGRETQRQQGLLLSQYQYDEQGRLQAHSISQQDRNLFQRRYAYDANGNLAGIDDSRKGSRSYHYDPLDRLINVRGSTPESFAHDPAGNLLGQGDQAAANLANVKGNRLLMQGDRHYDYDAYGNLTRERRGTGQKLVTEYRYDCQHRLIGVSLPGGSIASYKYDAFGRRIEKNVDGSTTEFLWQGERLIAESADNRYRSYIYEPGSFRPLAMLDGEGPLKATPFYYQLDHLGTPQELTDYSGEIMWSAKYRAYGNLAAIDVAEIDNPLRFQGQYFDAETGLHYNRHRYYNPGTGRFLTPDPIKLAGGLNNYQYVPNPTGWVDPLGLDTCPGADGCKPDFDADNATTKPAVDEGQPDTPDAGRKAHQFNSFHEYKVPENLYLKSDKVQFNRANKDLINKLNGDPAFRKNMYSRNPDLKTWVDDPKRNMGSSPTGYTWHHNEKPGVLQLVHRADHGGEHSVYHPTGKGGRDIWGGGREGREGKIKTE
ncbi:RHS repeat-associated core domain-containing protein [Pseudomonas sp. UMAB-40]|uniref:RHS repeat-associated core domain-containing protein n=1 Tax=Pseudomonas sp. UMAB-40 TaxID=1365407 RepID=UPI001C598CAA|nr:RHS repeat-associated core domain-containing protein [Pseudomonas sp. UMAB-40]